MRGALGLNPVHFHFSDPLAAGQGYQGYVSVGLQSKRPRIPMVAKSSYSLADPQDLQCSPLGRKGWQAKVEVGFWVCKQP